MLGFTIYYAKTHLHTFARCHVPHTHGTIRASADDLLVVELQAQHRPLMPAELASECVRRLQIPHLLRNKCSDVVCVRAIDGVIRSSHEIMRIRNPMATLTSIFQPMNVTI